jgi:hypothetical protein
LGWMASMWVGAGGACGRRGARWATLQSCPRQVPRCAAV